jgi:3-oxoacyl-[acyl-carrier protein] reductase
MISIVSGGSRGLGLAIVQRLLARGDRVATFSRTSSPSLAALATAHPDRLVTIPLDGTCTAAVVSFVQQVVERFGTIDHCIANAAIAHEGVLATMRDDEIDALLAVNLRASIVLVRECVRQMLTTSAAQPTPPVFVESDANPTPRTEAAPRVQDRPAETRCPSVTLISSVVASHGSAGLSVYAATKAGLEGFARSLAREVGPRGIRVNCVAPGFVETDLSASLSPENRVRIARRTALGRLGAPADVVGAVAFLASPAAAFITGQVLPVDGGG